MTTSLLAIIIAAILFQQTLAATLSKVIVIHRHGIRTPVAPLPFPDSQVWRNNLAMESSVSPLKKEQIFNIFPSATDCILPGNTFTGALTDSGAAQHFELGKQLRSHYGEALGLKEMRSELLHLESTWKPRTIKSLQAHLAGWFSQDAVVSQPNITTSEITDLYANWYETPMACPMVKPIYDKLVQSPVYLRYLEKEEPFRRDLSKKLKLPLSEVDFFLLHDSLACYVAEGFTLPGNLTVEENNRIEEIATWMYNFLFSDEEFVRLNIGQFLKRLERFIVTNDEKKLLVFSTHDMGIHPILGAHKHFPKEWPTFASNIVYEIYNNNTLRIIYNQDKILEIPGCGQNLCPFDTYFSFIRWAIPEDWKQECRISSPTSHYNVQLSAYDNLRARST